MFRAIPAILFACGLTLISTGALQAQPQTDVEPTGFKNVRLEVFPEYDDPRLLVMFEGEIVGTRAPALVRFLVPSGAEMYSAGSKDAQGQYVKGISNVAPAGGPPDRKASTVSGWDEISYEAQTELVRMEYYAPLILGNPDKTIGYEFRSFYPLENMTVTVQEPKRSSNFVVSPDAEATTIDSQGFRIHFFSFDNPDVSAPLRFDISYTRSETRPSTQVTAASGSSTGMVIGLVLVVVVLGGGGVYLMTRSHPKARTRNRRPSGKAAPAARRGQAAPRFCRQCGKRLEAPSRFCPECGSSLQ